MAKVGPMAFRGKEGPFLIDEAALEALIRNLRENGTRVIGPVLGDGAIRFDEVDSLAALPRGWRDVAEPGSYRLEPSGQGRIFDYTVTPQAWKRFLYPPRLTIWRGERSPEGRVSVQGGGGHPPSQALLGLRACDLAAIGILDRVLLEGPVPDPDYLRRREKTLLLPVNCTRSAATCFCASVGTGPKAGRDFDLAFTELVTEEGSTFLVDLGSEKGAELLADLPHRQANEAERRRGDGACAEAGRQQRSLPADALADRYEQVLSHPRWEDIACRCLFCGNCTLACPTCFCTTFEETSDLARTRTERSRHWDSCFNTSFSYLHGGGVRSSGAARYRQWLLHKVVTWQEQFGTVGCVGCGRCITWCPVGIDITEESHALLAGTEQGLGGNRDADKHV